MELHERNVRHAMTRCRTCINLAVASEVRSDADLLSDSSPLADMRFRALLGQESWGRLPAAVRHRFGKRLDEGRTVTYTGHVAECRMSVAGHLLAQLLRVVGGPLPTNCDSGVPATVVVTEDRAAGGQFWTRIYGRHAGFPRVICSSKRFCGPTGLEEYIGAGIGMALTVSADDEALHFHSDHYFFEFGSIRWRLPYWLEPGVLRVSHVDTGAGHFDFVLSLRHPRFGQLVHQLARFADAPGVSSDAATAELPRPEVL